MVADQIQPWYRSTESNTAAAEISLALVHAAAQITLLIIQGLPVMHLEGKLHQKQTSWVEPGCPFSGKHSDLHRPTGHTGWFASYGGQLLRKSWTQMCLWQLWKKCAPWLWPVSKHTKRWAHFISLLVALQLVCWMNFPPTLDPTTLACCSVSVEANEHAGSIRQNLS